MPLKFTLRIFCTMYIVSSEHSVRCTLSFYNTLYNGIVDLEHSVQCALSVQNNLHNLHYQFETLCTMYIVNLEHSVHYIVCLEHSVQCTLSV